MDVGQMSTTAVALPDCRLIHKHVYALEPLDQRERTLSPIINLSIGYQSAGWVSAAGVRQSLKSDFQDRISHRVCINKSHKYWCAVKEVLFANHKESPMHFIQGASQRPTGRLHPRLRLRH